MSDSHASIILRANPVPYGLSYHLEIQMLCSKSVLDAKDDIHLKAEVHFLHLSESLTVLSSLHLLYMKTTTAQKCENTEES